MSANTIKGDKKRMSLPSLPWWHPDRHLDRRPHLHRRTLFFRAVRRFFEAQDFIEVDCHHIQKSPGNEVHLHALEVFVTSLDGEKVPRYLHTSPEFSCKKLLAAGEKKIFTLTHVFRDREKSRTHTPEFTMLEWYRAGVSYREGIKDTLDLLKEAGKLAPKRLLCFKDQVCDPFQEAEYLTVFEAFLRYAKVDLDATLSEAGKPNRQILAEQLKNVGFSPDPSDEWSDLFSKALSAFVEPNLGMERPTVLYAYPLPEAALAKPSLDFPKTAERFEIYACGVELANGFGELTDPLIQKKRFIEDMNEKERRYGLRYPIDDDFLEALSLMPEATGVALGFDRLLMLACHARALDDVLWTPFCW